MNRKNVRVPSREPEFVQSLSEATEALGGDAGYFMMRTHDEGKDIRYVLLACDARWGIEYAAKDCSSNDPWFRHATGSSAPVRSADVSCRSDQERAVVELAATHGFSRAALFPAPSPQGRSRIALLVIGSRDLTVWRRFESTAYRAEARHIAMALHESWVEEMRGEFIQSSELSALDLRILELELQGLRTKAIARHLKSTTAAVNSRIQRLNSKLRVTTRRSAALRSLELGLVCPSDFQDSHVGHPTSPKGMGGR